MPAMTTHSRILGCLYGQAVGDALGMPSELWPQSQVKHYFGWIDTFLPGPAENPAAAGFAAGEFTDDTQQAIALLEALLSEQGRVNPQCIAANILAWAERVRAFDNNILGPTSKKALLAFKEGSAIADIPANGTTNGAAMRISPLGCLLPTQDRTDFIRQVIQACSPTHKSDIAVAGAAVIAWSVSRAIEGVGWPGIKLELPSIAYSAQQQGTTTFSPMLSARLKWVFSLDTSLHNSPPSKWLDMLYQGVGVGMETIESVPSAIALVDAAQGNPQECAILAANLGGDTDTIGAMATAICGALSGIEAFPTDWITTINQANRVDFQPYADALAQLRMAR